MSSAPGAPQGTKKTSSKRDRFASFFGIRRGRESEEPSSKYVATSNTKSSASPHASLDSLPPYPCPPPYRTPPDSPAKTALDLEPTSPATPRGRRLFSGTISISKAGLASPSRRPAISTSSSATQSSPSLITPFSSAPAIWTTAPSPPATPFVSISSAPPIPIIRLDRRASPSRPEVRNNSAPELFDPSRLSPHTASHPGSSIKLAPCPPQRMKGHIPGSMSGSYVPGGIGRSFLPGAHSQPSTFIRSCSSHSPYSPTKARRRPSTAGASINTSSGPGVSGTITSKPREIRRFPSLPAVDDPGPFARKIQNSRSTVPPRSR